MCKFKPNAEEKKQLKKKELTRIYCKESYCNKEPIRRCDDCGKPLCRSHVTRTEGMDRCFDCSMIHTHKLIEQIEKREKERECRSSRLAD